MLKLAEHCQKRVCILLLDTTSHSMWKADKGRKDESKKLESNDNKTLGKSNYWASYIKSNFYNNGIPGSIKLVMIQR